MNNDDFFESINVLFDKMLKEYKELGGKVRRLDEYADTSKVEDELSTLHRRFMAARKGLSIVNSLPYGQSKLKHTKRVMSNLSTIRTMLKELEKTMGQTLSR